MTPEDVRLDRVPHLDERSRPFGLAARAATPLPSLDRLRARRRVWTPNAILDQGREGACVGFGIAGELGSTPQRWPKVTSAEAFDLYRRAQAIDRGEGRHYREGATLLAGLKAAVGAGLATRYEWAFTLQEYLYGLTRRRPAVHGVTVTEKMFTPDRDGLMTLTGRVVGGHCLYAFGYYPPGSHPAGWPFGVVALAQSWGTDFGAAGVVYANVDDWWTLLGENGETAFLIDRRPPRAA